MYLVSFIVGKDVRYYECIKMFSSSCGKYVLCL